jgi:D-amino peptidase
MTADAHKILVAMDIEGVAGVWRPEQTQAGQAEHERARHWMTQEANAAIRGAFEGGATDVLVSDSHGNFCNLLPDELDPRALTIQGKPRLLGMMAGVEQNVKGVLMVGWHAKAKSRGVLAHTTNSFAFARVWLGDHEVGEIGLYAALAASFGVPVLMASGCDVMAEEFHALLPHAACAIVKWSEGARSGRSLSPAHAQALIQRTARDNVHRALSGVGEVGATTAAALAPVVVRLQCQTPALADLFELWPSVERESGDILRIPCADIRSAVRSLNALAAMSSALR